MAALLWTLWPAILGACVTGLVIYLSLRGISHSAMYSQSDEAQVITLQHDSHDKPIAG